jgi:hypothetical protein
MLKIIPIIILIGLPIWLLVERKGMSTQMTADAAKISELQKELDALKAKRKNWVEEKSPFTNPLAPPGTHAPSGSHSVPIGKGMLLDRPAH